MKTLALILAAGQGKRMHSAQPKVLQPVGGKAMIVHLLETLQALAAPGTRCAWRWMRLPRPSWC